MTLSSLPAHTQSSVTTLRSAAFRFCVSRAQKARKSMLRKRWMPAQTFSLPSVLSQTAGKKKEKTLHSFADHLQKVYTLGAHTNLVSEAKQQAGSARAQQMNTLLGPLQSLELPKNKAKKTQPLTLVHKDTAKSMQRFYPVGKAVYPSYGCLRVTSVANNCFVTITDVWGKSFTQGSTGSVGFSSKQRLSHPAFSLGMHMAKKALQGGMKTFLLVLGGPGKSTGAAQAGILKVVQRHWKAARKENLIPTFKRGGTILLKAVPHNGCRLPARRRKRRKTKVRPLKVGKF